MVLETLVSCHITTRGHSPEDRDVRWSETTRSCSDISLVDVF